MRRVAVIALLAFAAACTPEQIAVFQQLTPDQQTAVIDGLRPPADCHSAIRRTWPPHLHGWADKIVRRESGNNPAAANRSSSARGCFQLMMSYHAWRLTAVGCSPDRWADPWCNAAAAWTLYAEQGPGPWRLTNY